MFERFTRRSGGCGMSSPNSNDGSEKRYTTGYRELLTCSPPLTAGVPRAASCFNDAAHRVDSWFSRGPLKGPLPSLNEEPADPAGTHCIFTGVYFGPVRP